MRSGSVDEKGEDEEDAEDDDKENMYEEAFAIFKKFEVNSSAVQVLLTYSLNIIQVHY